MSWNEGWPDWCDQGRKVVIEWGNGLRAEGKLEVDDWFPDGEGDEIPVWVVVTESGDRHSFASSDRWEFLS